MLLFALAAVVLTILLQPRPGQMLGGWSKLADSIQKAAATIDQESGSKVAAELTKDKFSHEKAADEAGARALSDTVKKLVTQSGELVTGRNALAKNIADIGEKTGAAGLPDEKELRKISQSAAADKVNTAVAAMIEGREQTYANFAKLASQLGAGIDRNQLRSANPAALAPFNNAVSAIRKRRSTYESCFQKVESQLGSGSRLDFSADKYNQTIARTGDTIRAFAQKLAALEKALAEVKRENEGLKNNIDDQNRQIASRERTVADQKKVIDSLKIALGELPNNNAAPEKWDAGSPQSRDVLIGRIIDINPEYGYAELDIGSSTVVNQEINGEQVKVSPKIDAGLEFLVGRAADEDLIYVARVRLEEVGSNASTARIPSGSDIKVGDLIYFRRTK